MSKKTKTITVEFTDRELQIISASILFSIDMARAFNNLGTKSRSELLALAQRVDVLRDFGSVPLDFARDEK